MLRDVISLAGEQNEGFFLAVHHFALFKKDYFKMKVVCPGTFYSRITKVDNNLCLKVLVVEMVLRRLYSGNQHHQTFGRGTSRSGDMKNQLFANPKGLEKFTSGLGELGRNMQKGIIKMHTPMPSSGERLKNVRSLQMILLFIISPSGLLDWIVIIMGRRHLLFPLLQLRIEQLLDVFLMLLELLSTSIPSPTHLVVRKLMSKQ